MEDARCALGQSNRRIDSPDEAVDMQFGIRSGRFPVNRYKILPKTLSRRVRRGRSKRQKKLAEIAVQRTVLAAAALLMTGGKAKNDDNTDKNAEADGRHSGPPSGDAYTDWVLLVLRSMREAGRCGTAMRDSEAGRRGNK
jgi:hypothetical protein